MVGSGDKLHGLRILIVEDEYVLASVLEDFVKLYGGTVAGLATSEEEALAVIDRMAVNGAIVDINLNGIRCFSLIEVLTRRSVPVILTTGYHVESVPKEFQHLPFFEKPFDLGELAECIADCCRGKRGRKPKIDGGRPSA